MPARGESLAMRGWVDHLGVWCPTRAWLALFIASLALAILGCRQPARRIALARATMLGSMILILLVAIVPVPRHDVVRGAAGCGRAAASAPVDVVGRRSEGRAGSPGDRGLAPGAGRLLPGRGRLLPDRPDRRLLGPGLADRPSPTCLALLPDAGDL